MNNHTGFVVITKDGNILKEKNNYIDDFGVKRFTNWHDIDVKKIKDLCLYYKGSCVAKINKEIFPNFDEKNYFYFSVGSQQLSESELNRVGRKIGAKNEQYMFYFFVDENTGIVTKKSFIF